MLHRLNVPSCHIHLEWIVQLQRRLLAALCDPNATSSQVTLDWVLACLADLNPQWVTAFCRRKDRIANIGKTMLEHMQALAAFSAIVKQQLLNAFDNDQLFPLAFDPVSPQVCVLCDITFLNAEETKAVRGFLESFYDPNFYASVGYYIPQGDGSKLHFHKDKYLERFNAENPDVLVCPFCDGSREGAQIDHFYPKSKYPSLSCHPLNLVPICKNCNDRANKGEKVPLTPNAPDPMADWFHPYLRPAAGTFQIKFQNHPEGTTPVLVSSDAQNQTRLNNLASLINLEERWRNQLSLKVRSTQRMIAKHKERAGALTESELCAKLSEWAENAECEYGLQPYSIVSAYYLTSVAAKEPETFDELRVYALGLDPVSTRSC